MLSWFWCVPNYWKDVRVFYTRFSLFVRLDSFNLLLNFVSLFENWLILWVFSWWKNVNDGKFGSYIIGYSLCLRRLVFNIEVLFYLFEIAWSCYYILLVLSCFFFDKCLLMFIGFNFFFSPSYFLLSLLFVMPYFVAVDKSLTYVFIWFLMVNYRTFDTIWCFYSWESLS